MENPLPATAIDHIVEDEEYVNIKWLRADHKELFSAYIIEASKDGQTYQRLNEIPFVGGETEEYPSRYFSYKHQVENYNPHYYRIRGITPFGQTSPASPPMRGMARDRTPAGKPGNIKVLCNESLATVHLQWDRPQGEDLSGYHIARALRFDGNYQFINEQPRPPDSTHFSESVPNTRMIYYYKIASLDTAGNINFSRIVQAAFRDTLAPATPSGLSGEIDSNGVVTLRWDRGPEPDLRGYYVYMANQQDHYYTNMTSRPVLDTVWRDTITLKTFTEEIFYRVAAADYHSHFSEWTEPYRLAKPDTIRPFAPSFSRYRVEKDHILLTSTPSRSKDVQVHRLLKRMKPAKSWSEVTEFDIKSGAYRDYDVEPGKFYDYKLIAIDDAGLESENSPVISVKYIDFSRPEAPVITGCNMENQTNTITWEVNDEKTAGFIVYRSVNSGPYTTLARIDKVTRYTDSTVSREKKYAYKIKSIWDDGQKSDFSTSATPIESQ